MQAHGSESCSVIAPRQPGAAPHSIPAPVSLYAVKCTENLQAPRVVCAVFLTLLASPSGHSNQEQQLTSVPPPRTGLSSSVPQLPPLLGTLLFQTPSFSPLSAR